jgi:cellulose synthase/poly-beta-1,6-N-acetylglucosamine synthase-like glycosyltransferase
MNVSLIIIGLLGVCYGLLILWYGLGWKQLPLFIPSKPASGRTRVTVIIPARDEEQNLPALLQAIKQQTYAAAWLEVIVIDDFSTDNTAQVVSGFPASNIRLLRMSDHLDITQRLNSYKKKAIEIAIGQATGQLIVTTDADCIMGPRWIEMLVQYYETYRPKFIAAPVSFYKEDNFFKILQSLDFMNMQGITGSVIRLKIGTMCNGANMAYEKEVFHELGGFKGIDNIASGDDMLFMYKVYQKYPDSIGYLKNEEAIVRTLPVDTFSAFMHQRIRWSSKADKYEDRRLTWMLAVVYLWNAALLVMGMVALFYPVWWYWFLISMLFKTTVELYFMVPIARFFHKTALLVWVIPGQLFHIPYIVIAGWLGKFGTYKWKGRKVN